MKTVHYFSDEYLERCRALSCEEILEYLENYRLMQQGGEKSRIISLRVPVPLLACFKTKARLHNTKYQTQIKKLMYEWVTNEGD